MRGLGTICSSIETEPNTLGPFERETMKLVSDESAYAKGDQASLGITFQASGSSPVTAGECPRFFLTWKSPGGDAGAFPASPVGGCRSGQSDWRGGFRVLADVAQRDDDLGEYSFEIFQMIGPGDDGEVQFAHSNQLQVLLGDALSRRRNWGPVVHGIAVDVTLDRDTYRLGEDVPLHIAILNASASAPIYTSNVWPVGVEVRNASGRVLSDNERFPTGVFVSNGPGPWHIPIGKEELIERTLFGAEAPSRNWLPNHPGMYTIVVTWSPLDDSNSGSSRLAGIMGSDPGIVYARAQATTTLHIIDPNQDE
jgi:hypothetical protein